MRRAIFLWGGVTALATAACSGESTNDIGDPFGALLEVHVAATDAMTTAGFNTLVVACEPIGSTWQGRAVVSRYDLSTAPLPLKAECSSGIGDNPAAKWRVTAFLSASAKAASTNLVEPTPVPESGAPSSQALVDLGACSVGCVADLGLSL